MYPKGVSELIQGWMKGFTAGAGGTSPLVLISVIAWLTGALGTARHLAVDLFRGPTGTAFVFVLLYLFYTFQIRGYLRRAGRFHGLTAILYPLPMCFFVFVFLGSLVFRVTGHRFVWKGRRLSR
jgi:4,4'-diaponeurosporenoate glycosyltransferase